MADRAPSGTLLAAGAGLLALAALALGWGQPRNQPQDLLQIAAPPLEKTVAVPADSGWVDTGIDVAPGEELRFSASGEIDLQRGNPEAVCGAAGIDLVTGEQPVPHANLGALIGKVGQLVARRVDKDSGMEVRDEIFVLFTVGPEGALTAPFKGRLYLGVNENVLRDNGGEYSVVVVRRPV
jgi:hypothetical protein